MVGEVVVVGDVSSETVTPKDSERSRGLTFQCVWLARLSLQVVQKQLLHRSSTIHE